MQTIVRIAKTELRTLFYSPIAWFLLIVFMVQCAFFYVNSLSQVAVQQEIGGYNLNFLNYLTSAIFLSGQGVFVSVMQNLYLYVPLLTMSLISRETGSGTIKLLYSSPIDVSEIVFGKFLAMMAYSLLLLAVVCVFVVSGIFQIEHVETGMLVTGLIGFYLLLCTYSAIGLFMSCLTTYQVVAAICTFVMIGILTYVGSLWQDIEMVRELTYFLSIKGRTQNMLVGLLTSKDVIYFLLIIYLFLGFSILKLKAGMESKPPMVRAARYISVFASVLVLGYISSRPGLIAYYDATATKYRTITPQVQKIVKELKGAPLEVTVFNNFLGPYWFLGTPESYNQNIARWEAYARFKPDIKINTVMYYDSVFDSPYTLSGYDNKTLKQIAEQKAKSSGLNISRFKTPAEIRQRIDLKPELNRYVMLLKWKNRQTFLRVYDDQVIWPTETEVAAAMKRLLGAKLPKVYFLSGHLERDINKSGDKEYKNVTTLKTFRYSLLNQGFDVDTLSLEDRDIPADISVLVIAAPKLELNEPVLKKIDQYIESGGNILIAGEPGKQSILNPVAAKLGVQFMNGTVLQQSKEYAPDLVLADLTAAAGSFTKMLQRSVAYGNKISMSGVCGLTVAHSSKFSIAPLLVSDAKLSWNRMKPLDPDASNAAVNENGMSVNYVSTRDTAKRSKMGTVMFSPAEGDTRGPVTTAVSLVRKVNNREQRIIVAGDADFMSNAELQRYIPNVSTANFSFCTGLFSWLNYGEYPVETSRPEAKDRRVTVSTDQVVYLKVAYMWILPALLLIMGAIILVRRKRK